MSKTFIFKTDQGRLSYSMFKYVGIFFFIYMVD